MAPRRQAKQPAAETVAATAGGDVTPPKKRKITAKPLTEKPKPARPRVRAAKHNNNNDAAADEAAFSPKKLRTRINKTVAEVPKNTTVAKSRAKKANKQAETTTDTDEEIAEQREVVEKKQVVEKKARAKPAAKKAGTSKKPAAAKSRAKKSQDEVAIENGAEELEKGNTSKEKRTTRRKKVAEIPEEQDVPAATGKAQPAARSRKRKALENANDAIGGAENVQVTEKDEKSVADKKSRSKSKKVDTETSDAPKVKPKGRAVKSSAKVGTAQPLSEEVEIKQQSDQSVEIQENNSKTKNAKNTKRGNAKKATSKPKHNAAEEKIDDTPVEEAAPIETPESDVEENGDAEVSSTMEPKQKENKKKNVGKTNVITNDKTETKGILKKGPTVIANEEEATKVDEIIANLNLNLDETFALEENNLKKVIFSNQNDNSLEEEKSEMEIKVETEKINSSTEDAYCR